MDYRHEAMIRSHLDPIASAVIENAADEIEELEAIIRRMGALAGEQRAVFDKWVNDGWQGDTREQS